MSANNSSFTNDNDSGAAHPAQSNTLFAQQWAFSGTSYSGTVTESAHIDILDAWADFTGRGVRVGIIDNFFDIDHLDMNGRFDLAASRDLADQPDSMNIRPDSVGNSHGTMVAATLGANGDDGAGMVGAAFGATMVGYVLRFGGTSQARNTLTEHLNRALSDNIDILNNSWSFSTAFADDFSSSVWRDLAVALERHAVEGRGGLGTVMVVGAGNDRAYDAVRWWLDGDNTNNHNTTNSRYMITVGATGETGMVTDFSTPGASVFVAAPGEMILTANVEDGDGDRTDDYIFARGTSLSTPIVSGVVALMLEANHALGYRDVQDILALSADRIDPAGAGWINNGASNWNGGGMLVNSDVGFGLVDAHAAVRLAETWTGRQVHANEVQVTGIVGQEGSLAFVEGGMRTFDVALQNADVDFAAQWLELSVDIAHDNIGDLTITLVSPAGTRSVILDRPTGGSNTKDDLVFKLSSNQFWGESVNGNWTIEVADHGTGTTGMLRGAELRAYGSISADDLHVFTDDFADIPRGSAMILDAVGNDTINTAAIRQAVEINLESGTTSIILGKAVEIGTGSHIENASTGDGADSVRGNALNNVIHTGRGNDTIFFSVGADTLDGGADIDTLVVSGLRADFAMRMTDKGAQMVTIDTSGAAQPVVRVEAIEFLTFDDGTVSLSDFIRESEGRGDFSLGNETVHSDDNDNEDDAGTDDADDNNEGGSMPPQPIINIDAYLVVDGVTIATPQLVASKVPNVVDTAIFQDSTSGVRAVLHDHSDAQGITSQDAGRTIVVTNIIGSTRNDALTGNSRANLLDGGQGADTLAGRDGDDLYIVDGRTDRIVELSDHGTDSVQSSVSFRLPANVENLALTGAARVAYGNASDNVIVGTDGANIIDGRAGADTMMGGNGHDIYRVDHAGDTIVEMQTGGHDRVFADTSHTLSQFVEDVTLLGAADTNATGNDLANRVVGNVGDNYLQGAGGHDRIFGGAGNDTLEGGLGRDILHGGAGADVFMLDMPEARGFADIILDFNPLQDHLALNRGAFGFADGETISASNIRFGTKSLDADDFLIFNRRTGALLFDVDGNGDDAAIHIATLRKTAILTADCFDLI
jgi:Ca2+-binding RTX toxin-like protein/subtilisin-like proprotein convertase family protein